MCCGRAIRLHGYAHPGAPLPKNSKKTGKKVSQSRTNSRLVLHSLATSMRQQACKAAVRTDTLTGSTGTMVRHRQPPRLV